MTPKGRKSRCSRSFASGAGRSRGCLEYYDRGEAKRKLTPAPVVLQDEWRLRVSRVREEIAKAEAEIRARHAAIDEAYRSAKELLDRNPNRSFPLCDPHDFGLEVASGELTLAAFLR